MVQLQANPSLTHRNWTKTSNRYAHSFYPFCIVVFFLQIAAIFFLNHDIGSSSNNKPKSRDSHNRFYKVKQTNIKVNAATLRSRPDRDLPANVKLVSMENQIRSEFEVAVKSCLWYRRNDQAKMRVVADDDCDRQDHEFILHNPLDRDRFICDATIIVPAGGFARVNNSICRDLTTSRLFAVIPTLENMNRMPGVKIALSDAEDDELRSMEDFPCEIQCQSVASTSAVRDLSILDTPWTLRYSMESAANYPELEIDALAHQRNQFYATTSFDSEIPLPYFSWAEYSIQKPPVEYSQVIKGASFLASNCDSTSSRELVVQELMKFLRVDSLGACLQNAEPPAGSALNDTLSIKRRYMFHLAFENSIEKDYITEKLWSAFEAGTLPVYMGAPNIWHHVPPHSIISWHDFDSTADLGMFLQKVADNRVLYETYQAWRSLPLSTSFYQKYDFTRVHSMCRICRWAAARMYGFPFDHANQTILPPKIARKPCWDVATQLMSYPVREIFLQESRVLLAASEDQITCQTSEDEALKSTTVGTWKRSVSFADGVLDIEIEGTGEAGVYQLGLPIQGLALQVGAKQWQVQNDESRVIVLTNWNAKLQNDALSQAVANLDMRGLKHTKIRIIFDDVDLFHTDGSKDISYFANLMVKDFDMPIERFLIVDEM